MAGEIKKMAQNLEFPEILCNFAADIKQIIAIMIGTLKASDVYMDMLRSLPNEDKLDLISELIKSMKNAVGMKKEPKDIFARFSSDWGGDMPTEDYADMLRSENVETTRTVETW